MSITRDAMILNIHIGVWSGQRFDRDATSRVTRDANAQHDAARVNKHLVPREAMAKITTASNAIRAHYYAKTLPWRDNGDRLLTRKMYMEFMQSHGALVEAFNIEVEHFVTTHYPSAKAQAEFRMGDLFDARDYPPGEDLKRRFYVTLDIDAVTEANDFRVAMDVAEIDDIRARMEDNMRDRLGKAVGDVWLRLRKVIENLHERMADKEAIFRDSLLSNVRDLVDMIPALNVLDDPNLDGLANAAMDMLGDVSAADIRKQPELREAIANDAQDILDQMGGFMRAFDGVKS